MRILYRIPSARTPWNLTGVRGIPAERNTGRIFAIVGNKFNLNGTIVGANQKQKTLFTKIGFDTEIGPSKVFNGKHKSLIGNTGESFTSMIGNF